MVDARKIIGLAGKSGSGKDTAAEYISRHYAVARVALAEPIKNFAKDVFDFSDDQLYGDARDNIDERYITRYVRPWAPEANDIDDPRRGELSPEYLIPRKALQHIGTAIRELYVDAFVERALRVDAKRMVIPDVRYQNEVNAIKRAGGIVWKLERDAKKLPGNLAAHSSEDLESVSGFDWVIDNNRSLENLYEVISKLAEEYFNR